MPRNFSPGRGRSDKKMRRNFKHRFTTPTLFFRHPRPEYNSLEEVFGTVMKAFPGDAQATRKYMPATGASPVPLIKNIFYAFQNRGKLNHITGDMHYIALGAGPNTVLTIHDAYSVIKGSRIKKLLVKLLWFWLPALIVKRITTISPKSKNELEKIIPFARKKIKVVPNPYNPKLMQEVADRKQEADGKPVVLHLGTKANKNLERTIEALAGVDCKMMILGKLTPAQEDLLEKYEIDYATFFTLPYDEVIGLYHQCDVVCFASLYEGFGMPIIEAQAVGKSVVTSDVDPMNWVAGGAAHLVDPMNVESIRAGIIKVLNESAYRDELVRKGRENAKRFDPRKIANMYLEVYKEVVSF